MEKNDLPKKIKNFLKNNINNLVNNNELKLDKNSHELFLKIIIDNINNEKIIKYIIKIISFNIKSSDNKNIQEKSYALFLLLITNLNKENTIKYLTSLLIFLQDIININPIEIAFEKILQNLDKLEMKAFEIINGFCIYNIKNTENISQKRALLCYEKLIINYEIFIGNKYMIFKSFIDNIIFNLKIESLENIYQLMVCLNQIILISRENFKDYIEITIYYILNNIFMNDDKLILITLDIINNIIKFNQEKIEEFNNDINKYFKKLLDNKPLVSNIKKKIMKILNKLNIIEDNQNGEKKLKKNFSGLYKDKLQNSNIAGNNEIKKVEIFKKINKIKKKPKIQHNKNIKVEIFFKQNPKIELKNENAKRNYTPLNVYDRKIEENDYFIENQRKKFISTFINEDDYINPIKIWNNLDKNSKKNIKSKKLNDFNNKISIDKSINNSQITIYSQLKEEPKLDLIINEITQISKNQNFLAEKIISLEKSTYERINLFNEKINDLEKKVSKNEFINANNIGFKIIYPSNALNEKIIRFLNAKNENNEEIYLLFNITEQQIIDIDNNLIEDVINKLINYLNQDIFIHECINFIKKIFVKHKMRFQLSTIKKLLSCLNKLIMKSQILSKEDSLNISLIISSINIDKI